MICQGFLTCRKNDSESSVCHAFGSRRLRPLHASPISLWRESCDMFVQKKHPEAKSLAPDGTLCRADTKGLLQRAHITAGELRYVGKEADRKWEEGDDIGVLEFKTTEYGRSKRVVCE
jgi:hypothetical protein